MAGMHTYTLITTTLYIRHLTLRTSGEVCSVSSFVLPRSTKPIGCHQSDGVRGSRPLPRCCAKKRLYQLSHPLTDQAIPVAEPHGEVIRTRWAVLPYKLGRVEKHWAGFSQACSGGTESGWSTHFLSLPFPGMSERSQAKKNQTFSGFWTG